MRPTEPRPRYLAGKSYNYDNGWSCVFRNYLADNHCRYPHGYAPRIDLVFGADVLDHRGWVVPFGALAEVKAWLADLFDHKMLVSISDPELATWKILAEQDLVQLRFLPSGPVSCERLSDHVRNFVTLWLVREGYSSRVKLWECRVSEHPGNFAQT